MKHIKIILSLLVVVLISMMGVFIVEGITTPVIEERLAKEANAALFEIFPDADNMQDVTEEYPVDDVVTKVFVMTQGGNQVGVVYKGIIAGYNPGIEFLLGVDTVNDQIAGYSTLANGETAGIGKDLLASPLFAEQFVGVPTDMMRDNGADLVAGSTARLTLGGINNGIKAVLVYHGVNFKGEEAPVEETEEMKIERLKSEFFPGSTFTDVTGNYADNDYLFEILEASNGGFVITAIFNGYAKDSIYMFGVNDGIITGFGIVTTNETQGIGADLVLSEEFAAQFVNKNVDEIKDNGVDFVAGSTASITLNGVNESLEEILGYYNKEVAGIKDTEAPVITINEAKPTTLEVGSQVPNWGTYVTVTDNEDGFTTSNDAGSVVNMEVAGTYTVTYTAVDAAGNESTVTIEFTLTEEEVEFVLVPVPADHQSVLEGMDTAAQFNDELISQGNIKGIYTGRDLDGNVVSVFYYVTSNNGGYSADNHIMIQFDISNNTIIKVNVFDGNSSYTDDYATGKGKEIGHSDVATVWDGVSGLGQVSTGDLDSVSGTTADYSFPSFIESVEEAITYQITNNVGGAE